MASLRDLDASDKENEPAKLSVSPASAVPQKRSGAVRKLAGNDYGSPKRPLLTKPSPTQFAQHCSGKPSQPNPCGNVTKKAARADMGKPSSPAKRSDVFSSTGADKNPVFSTSFGRSHDVLKTSSATFDRLSTPKALSTAPRSQTTRLQSTSPVRPSSSNLRAARSLNSLKSSATMTKRVSVVHDEPAVASIQAKMDMQKDKFERELSNKQLEIEDLRSFLAKEQDRYEFVVRAGEAADKAQTEAQATIDKLTARNYNLSKDLARQVTLVENLRWDVEEALQASEELKKLPGGLDALYRRIETLLLEKDGLCKKNESLKMALDECNGNEELIERIRRAVLAFAGRAASFLSDSDYLEQCAHEAEGSFYSLLPSMNVCERLLARATSLSSKFGALEDALGTDDLNQHELLSAYYAVKHGNNDMLECIGARREAVHLQEQKVHLQRIIRGLKAEQDGINMLRSLSLPTPDSNIDESTLSDSSLDDVSERGVTFVEHVDMNSHWTAQLPSSEKTICCGSANSVHRAIWAKPEEEHRLALASGHLGKRQREE